MSGNARGVHDVTDLKVSNILWCERHRRISIRHQISLKMKSTEAKKKCELEDDTSFEWSPTSLPLPRLGYAPQPPTTWKPVEDRLALRLEFQTNWIAMKSLRVELLWDVVLTSLKSFDVKTPFTRDYLGIVISGASGTGKTRAGYQVGPLLADQLSKAGWSYARYFQVLPKSSRDSSHPKNDYAAQLLAEKWLKQSLALHHGVENGGEMGWIELLAGIRSTLLDASSTKLVLFVQIDEFHNDHAFCTHLVRQLSNLQAHTRFFQEAKVLIVPIFTGTWVGSLTRSTEYQTREFLLSGLDSLSDAKNLFQDQLKLDAHPSPDFPESDQDVILAHLGYIPRLISIFCKVIHSDKPSGFDTAWPLLRKKVRQAYPSDSLTTLEKKHLCLLSYFKIPISYAYRIGGRSLLDMLCTGILFLSRQGYYYTVDIPTIFYVQWLPKIFALEILVNPNDQLNECTLPHMAMSLHCTTYNMLRVWKEVQEGLKIQHDPYLDINRALTIPNDSLPTLKFSYDKKLLTAQVNLRLLYAGAVEGSKKAIDDEFEVFEVVVDHGRIGPMPVTLNSPQGKSQPTHELPLTASKDKAADAIRPHLVAEQYRTDWHFNLEGVAGANVSSTKLKAELDKERYGCRYLMFITPSPCTAEVTKEGVVLAHKPAKDGTRGPKASTSQTKVFPDLLLIRGAENMAKFCRGFLRDAKILQTTRSIS